MTEVELITGPNTSLLATFTVSSPSEINAANRGENISYELLNTLTKLTVASGETLTIDLGETQRHTRVTIEDNATLVVNGTLQCDELVVQGTLDNNGTVEVSDKYDFEYAEIEPYATFAGKYSLQETRDTTQKIFSNVPDDASIDTLIVGVEPSQELQNGDIRPYWCAVDNVTDSRNTALSDGPRITIELTMLARFSEYSDFATAKQNLEI